MGIQEDLSVDIEQSAYRAIDALSRYKFMLFGYWAAIWVHLNRIEGNKRPNPFRAFVDLAKEHELAGRKKYYDTQDSGLFAYRAAKEGK